MIEDKDQLRAILETAVGNKLMGKKMAYIDTNQPTIAYYFPFGDFVKEKKYKEGQSGV